jgi:RNA polymerase sigma-70 factor, ECF subfamily
MNSHLPRSLCLRALKVAAGQVTVTVSEAITLAQTEQDQLELAVRQHAQLVYQITYSVLRNHHDAEDATQETFVRMLRAKRKLWTVDDPRRWLAKIAWRVAVDKKKKIAEVGLEDMSEPIPHLCSKSDAADQELLNIEMTALLQQLIEKLPRRLREPLILSTLEETSTFDIAATLGTSESSGRSRIFRARQILKDRLERMLEGKL